MEECHRLAIRKSFSTIIRSLAENPDPFRCVIHDLTTEGILRFVAREEIECEKTFTAKARYLMSLIPRRGPTCYRIFIDSLNNNGLGDLADVITSNEPDETSSCPPTNPERSGDDVSSCQPTNAERSAQDDDSSCSICCVNERNTALVPCGHVFCVACSSRFHGECPMSSRECTEYVQNIYKLEIEEKL